MPDIVVGTLHVSANSVLRTTLKEAIFSFIQVGKLRHKEGSSKWQCWGINLGSHLQFALLTTARGVTQSFHHGTPLQKGTEDPEEILFLLVVSINIYHVRNEG